MASSQEQEDDPWGDVSADSGLAALEGDMGSDHDEKNDYNPLYGNVYQAVVAVGATALGLERQIEAAARGCEERRRNAVNEKHRVLVPSNFANERFCERVETPMAAAHRLRRRDLIGVLLKNGADPRSTFDGKITPLAAAAVIGKIAVVRHLISEGHDPNERMPEGSLVEGGTAIHAAFCGALFGYDGDGDADDPVPECGAAQPIGVLTRQLECVNALVLEFGADVNARDAEGATPYLYLKHVSWSRRQMNKTYLDILLTWLVTGLGADPNAKDTRGRTMFFYVVESDDPAALEIFLKYGASADVIDEDGTSALMCAVEFCAYAREGGEVVGRVLRESSPETRRAVRGSEGSVVDILLSRFWEVSRMFDWHHEVLGELLASGASFKPANAPMLLKAAALAADRREAELAARRSEARRARGRKELVGLAQDAADLKEEERVVQEKEARVAAREEELRGLGESGGGSGSEEEENESK